MADDTAKKPKGKKTTKARTSTRPPAPEPAEPRAETAARPTADRVSVMEGTLAGLVERVKDAERRTKELEAMVGQLQVSVPATLMAMSREQVKAAIAANPHAKFVVLEEYRHLSQVLPARREVKANQYRNLLDHVENGLRLGKKAG